MKSIRHLYMVMSIGLFGSAHATRQNHVTVFVEGAFDSQRQCAKYCGPRGFQATTGERIVCKEAQQLIKNPFIGIPFEDITHAQATKNILNPLNWVSFIQEYGFLKHAKKLGLKALIPSLSGESALTFSLNFGKFNLAQERDIALVAQRIKMARKAHPGKKIILWGCSRGAAAAFSAMATHHFKEVKLLVLDGCFDSMTHVLSERFKGIYTMLGLHHGIHALLHLLTEYQINGLSPLKLVERFPEGVPVAFITSKSDTSVSKECTKRLAIALKKRGKNPVHYLELDKAKHAHYSVGSGKDQKRYANFIAKLYQNYKID